MSSWKTDKNVYIVTKYIGHVHGRAIVNVEGFKHDILTKRILCVHLNPKIFETRDSLYVVEHEYGVMTELDLIDIQTDIRYFKNFGENYLNFISFNSLEQPNSYMKSVFS